MKPSHIYNGNVPPAAPPAPGDPAVPPGDPAAPPAPAAPVAPAVPGALAVSTAPFFCYLLFMSIFTAE